MEGFSICYRVAILLSILNTAAKSRAQPPPAPAPGPPAPLNLTAVLEKGGQFRTLIRLLQSTQLDERIAGQLSSSNAGLTLFAPSDNAFAGLSPGALNALSSQQQVALLEYHIIPTPIALPDFQTVSNPLSTQAGDSSPGQFPLNVTAAGNQVNISTGLVNATISGTVFSDGKLAVYQVDEVLLPPGVFRPSAPPPPAKAKGASSPGDGPSSSASADSADGSSAVEWRAGGGLGLPFAVAVSIFCWSF